MTDQPSQSVLDRRETRRIRARFQALYGSERHEGEGILADISYQGARVIGATTRLAMGATVKLFVFFHPGEPFVISGRIIRQTADEFALKFDKLEPELQHLVDDLVAIVSVDRLESGG